MLGLLFVAGLLSLNVAGLTTLILASQYPALPLSMLTATMAALFGIAVAGSGLDPEK
jgi:hypothetical protein